MIFDLFRQKGKIYSLEIFLPFLYDKETGGIFIKIRMYFSIIVRKKRKELGLSQEKVAEYAGMTAQMYREIEKGKRSTAGEMASYLYDSAYWNRRYFIASKASAGRR